jgi:hypothetical protein
VLPAGNGRNIIVGRAGVEVAGFAAQRDESPHTHVNAGAEIKYTPSQLPRSLVEPAIEALVQTQVDREFG